jgi:hypothetical protein
MIHLIYIYFIVNAFIAGVSVGYREKLLDIVVSLTIGLPYYGIVFVYTCIEALIIWIGRVSLIRGWYRLYFTSYFENMSELAIKIRRQQYLGTRKNSKNANSYERFFLRHLDKKYGYGITKGDPKP